MTTEIIICGVPFGTNGERDALRQVKDHGFTSVQIYTFWRDFEPDRRGQFDWAKLDRKVELIQAAGLKYIPFLLIGPAYAAPDWWLADPAHVGLRCLEHGKESLVESIWNPAFRDEVTRILEGFAGHYNPWNVMESVLAGICGDYGEAIFPALGNWPGTYHTHRGYWCGGTDARDSFRAAMKEQYGALDELNRAWRGHYAAFAEIEPMLAHQSPSRTAYFDLVTWYRDSMTRYAEFWMAECRRVFPDLTAYLCTGGADDEITSGALFAAQAKIAAQHHGGIRLTNEGNKFDYNFPLTAPTHAACQFYGASFGLEPVGPMTEQGVRTRIFSSAAFGNRQIFHFYNNVFDRENRPLPAAEVIRDCSALQREQQVERGIAFFWPLDQGVVQGPLMGEVRDALLHIRRHYPVSPVTEQMILDGALEDYQCLIMIGATTTRAAVLKRLACWVREQGGRILACSLCRDLELEPVEEFESLFGITPDSEDAWGHHGETIRAPEGYDHLGKIARFRSEHGWMHLLEKTEKISCAVEGAGGGMIPDNNATRTLPVSALFRRKHDGGGEATFYCGPIALKRDPQAVFVDAGVFSALLDDVCAQSGVPPLRTEPDELARARVGEGLLFLREGAIELRRG